MLVEQILALDSLFTSPSLCVLSQQHPVLHCNGKSSLYGSLLWLVRQTQVMLFVPQTHPNSCSKATIRPPFNSRILPSLVLPSFLLSYLTAAISHQND